MNIYIVYTYVPIYLHINMCTYTTATAQFGRPSPLGVLQGRLRRDGAIVESLVVG
jgi:hypothetical protein